MSITHPTRRVILGAATGLAWAGTARAEEAVSISVVDVAGNLALSQRAFEAFRKANPGRVSKISFSQAPAPELPAKIKAQQAAGRVDIDIVLTGTDGLAAGIEQKLWTPLFPDQAAHLPDLKAVLLPAAYDMQALAQGQGCVTAYYPSGPLIEYMPDKVSPVPTTAEELLAWCKAHPKRFVYGRPANSGPGRTFLMGLPYILGDSNPKDPEKGWDKTWAFLKELGTTIEYYPSGTGATMKELGEGSRDMIVSTTGWDINPRALGTVPKEARVQALRGFHWVTDAHYVVIPKGIPDAKMAVLLDLLSFLLTPAAQAFNYDKGYFYPGPAVANVPLSMAPQESQDIVAEFGRPEYAALIAGNPVETPLVADKLVYAFRRWDQEVGTVTAK